MKKNILTLNFLILISICSLFANAQDHLNAHLPDNPPFGYFDSPTSGTLVSGSIALTGWALDDTKVESVEIYMILGVNNIYIGNATFEEGARPDVKKAFPDYPNNSCAGWGYMLLTNLLPKSGNGNYIFCAVAIDNTGNQTILGYKNIIGNNAQSQKPFGAIDTPKPGESISGVYAIQGWALTPLPNKIPEDGSTLKIFIDEKDIGNADYNLYRADIASLFPEYLNSNGALVYFELNTKSFNDGVHKLEFLAIDNAGNFGSIGSRYIKFDNGFTPDFTLMVNSLDPQIVSAKVSNGNLIDFYGKRDSSGIPININKIVVKNKDNKELVYHLDEKNRPVKIITEDKTEFKLEWLSDKRIVLTVLAEGGEIQISTEIDLSNNNQVEKFSFEPNQNIIRKKDNIELKSTDFPLEIQNCNYEDNIYNAGECILNVTKCEEPTDADVWIDIYTDTDNPLDSIKLKRIFPDRISKGVYRGIIPFNNNISVDPEHICTSVGVTLDVLKTAYENQAWPKICSTLAVVVALFQPMPYAIYGGCLAITRASELIINILSYSPDASMPNITELICDATISNFDIPGKIVLIGVADGIPSSYYSIPVHVTGNGPYPNINIDMGSDTKIGGLTLSPSAPSNGQGYTAKASALCVTAGSKVKLSIVGTDGYTDSITKSITNNQKNAEYTLTVPGADSGVRDICTFEIFLPNGKILRHTASLVFGN